jgi:hypothetical protein
MSRAGDSRYHAAGNWLWAAAVMAAISAMWAAVDLPTVSVLFGATTIFLVWYTQIFRPWRRRRRLRRPFDAHFLITAADQFPLDYVQQNNREHYVKKLVVPPHSEIPIQIVLVPKVSFMQHELYFGCDESLMDKNKPRATEWFVPFVREGVRKSGKPGPDHPGHYTDINGFYHVRENYLYTADCRIIGFKLLTGRTGTFRAQVYTQTDDVRGRADLKIKVEEPAKTKMRCYRKWHRIRFCMTAPPAWAQDQPNSNTPFIAVIGPSRRQRAIGITSP